MPIRFDSSFSSGNGICLRTEYQDTQAVIYVSPNPCDSPEALWFHFRLTRLRLSDKCSSSCGALKIVLRHALNLLCVFPPYTVLPVCRIGDGDWQRLPAGTVEEKPDGQIEISWELDVDAPSISFAFCYPYGEDELSTLLTDIGWQQDVVGVSQHGRPLYRVASSYGEPDGTQPGIYLLARQHSGETPGSWVLDGFIRRLAEAGAPAGVYWGVPLANIDGVEEGAYGKDPFPYDLNRAWGTPAMRHETLVMQRDIQRWMSRCSPRLLLDFHAPGATEDEGVYCFSPPVEADSPIAKRMESCASMIETSLGKEWVAPPFVRVFPGTWSRWNTPTVIHYAADVCGLPALSFEIPYALCKGRVLTCDEYRQIGALIGEGVMQFLETDA